MIMSTILLDEGKRFFSAAKLDGIISLFPNEWAKLKSTFFSESCFIIAEPNELKVCPSSIKIIFLAFFNSFIKIEMFGFDKFE